MRTITVIMFVLVLFSGVYAGPPEPDTGAGAVRIVSVKPAAYDVYAIASIEYPGSWGDNLIFTLEMSGKQVRTRRIAGGFSGGRNTADLMFFPRKAGRQNVTVKTVVNGRSVRSTSSFSWKQAPFIAVVGHAGDREILTAKDKLVVAAANIIDVRISFNGKDMYGKPSGSDIQGYSLDPAWRHGKNVLTVSGNKFDGSLIVRNFTFFYLGEDGTLPLGEKAVFYYGKEGSKSGPFYDVRVEGEALAPVRNVRTDHVSMDKEGWLASDTMLGKEFRAQKPGRAVIQVSLKPHFLDPMKLHTELAITVASP